MKLAPDTQVACPGCGLLAPALDGPTHRYMTSSPACFARFGEVLAADYSDPERMRFHQLVVDAWAVQHPGTPAPVTAQSVWIHLATLCLVLERDADPAAGPRLHKAMVERDSFEWLEPPTNPAWLTVEHMAGATDVATAEQLAREWARSAWEAWSTHHVAVRSWLDADQASTNRS